MRRLQLDNTNSTITSPLVAKILAIVIANCIAAVCISSCSFSDSGPEPEETQSSTKSTSAEPTSSESATVVTGTTEPSPADWGPVIFEDNFDDPSLLQWNIRDYDYVSYDYAYMNAGNVSVRDGELVIVTKREPEPRLFKNDPNQRERYYSTGYVDTIGKFSHQYGRVEMRAKLPEVPGQSRGVWPAFWMRPDDKTNPGEIDIMEAYGSPQPANNDNPLGRTEATVHFSQEAGNRIMEKGITPAELNLNDGQFHLWAVEWTPEAITFFVDGQQYHQVTAASPHYGEYFADGDLFHLRLNTQVGNNDWGIPNEAETANYFEYIIDYVRVWSLPQ